MSYRNSHPIRGKDYPSNLQEFDKWFMTEEDCFEYLKQLRWPDGFVCQKCHGVKYWEMKTGLYRCVGCQYKASVTAGTIFQGTRKPLKLWFHAAWHLTTQKYGGNALGLQRHLGLGSYQTAWSWHHKMRCAMIRPGREKLSGKVEIDETFVGGTEEGGKRGRGSARKKIVAIAIEIHEPKGYGRVRLQLIPDASRNSLIPFVCNTVEMGSTVLTDSWRGYNGLHKHGYLHNKVNLSESGDPAHVVMPAVHRIASLLKRWVIGTLQGSISDKHFNYFLDEYAFRFNRRHSKARGLLFYRLLQQAVMVDPLTYNGIVDRPE